jgi:hypothetical protein
MGLLGVGRQGQSEAGSLHGAEWRGPFGGEASRLGQLLFRELGLMDGLG